MRAALITQYNQPLEVRSFQTRRPESGMPSSKPRHVEFAAAIGTCGSTTGPGWE